MSFPPLDLDVLRITPRIVAIPVIHGSGDCALAVRRLMLEHSFDCVAVPLPESFRAEVLEAVATLPAPAIVVQRESSVRFAAEDEWRANDWLRGDSDRGNEDDSRGEGRSARRGDAEVPGASYVPIDPCQPVIAALRIALGERIACEFIDMETNVFEPVSVTMPDPYALKQVSPDRFAAAVLPALAPPPPGQPMQRIQAMAHRLRQLQIDYRSILLVCSLQDWPWIRDAVVRGPADVPEEDSVNPVESFGVDPKSLLFLFGELPFITGLYERARLELDEDENLSVDGIKELLLAARTAYYRELKGRARRVTPHTLRVCLKYMRNLSLMHRRLTPDLYTVVMASKQVAGDSFAVHVAETARDYPYGPPPSSPLARLGIDRIRFPDGDVRQAKSRLPGQPMEWRSCELQRRPDRSDQQRWQMQWNPLGQCSWPPEDEQIENFRTHVMDRAREIMGADLARTEKFTTSVRGGIDMRDTVRTGHTGDTYARVLPPSRGSLDAVVMLFDSPADPRDYPMRTTWFAEHEEESTLAFYATDFRKEMIGPGIGLATYGGAMFLFPPVAIPDIWHDPRLHFAETLEERLLAAACMYSRHPQIALLSMYPPGAGWRRLAQRFKKRWVHVPLGQFSDSTVQQLRMAHVLNGKQVRSFAAHFIRKP